MLANCNFWSNGWLIGFAINGICLGLASILVVAELALTANPRETEQLAIKAFLYFFMSIACCLFAVFLACK